MRRPSRSTSARPTTPETSSAIVYDICRATTSGGCNTFTPTCTTAAGAASFNDTGANCGGAALSAGTRYYFVVRAKDEAGLEETNTIEKSARTWSTGIVQAITNHIGEHTCSLISDGTVKCWGANTYGQVGEGSDGNTIPTPVAVSSLSAVVAIAAGSIHTCSLLTDGTVKCWGDNLSGELGDGTTANKSTPVAVSSLSNAVAVAGGRYHTCSLLSDGTVKCWGDNDYGQLGDRTTANITPAGGSALWRKSTPVPVQNLP